jgi:hypothetical protein
MLGWWMTVVGCRPEPPEARPADLLINEVLSRNVAAWVDPASGECPEHDDVIELFHAGRRPVRLSDFALEDDGGEPVVLPDREVLPGERVLLVADDEDTPGHLPFQVSSAGERLTLWRGADVADRVQVPSLEVDEAWARWGDGGPWRFSVPTPGAENESPPDDPCFAPHPGFDDHTFPCLATRAGFDAAAGSRAGTHVVKFEILGFPSDDLEVRFLDSRFYDLHDEWYLFRMMNGREVRGEEQFRPFPGEFSDIGALYAWAALQDLPALFPPTFVTWTPTGRLNSPRFYELALGRPRRIGAGSVIRIDADREGRTRWVFELEHSDEVVVDEIPAFFRTLDAALGPEIDAELAWVVRSAHQEEVARELERQGSPFAARIVRYDELSVPGAVEVYRGGTVAGRVRIVRAGEDGLEDAGPTDVLVLEEVPDWLPPAAALITTAPQTPLSHVALLAESRGIPNLSVAGLGQDPRWDAWGRVRRPIVLRATAPDGLEVRELTDDEWATWTILQEPVVGTLERVDGSDAPWVLDLSTVPVDEMPALRPTFGGKSAGYLALLDTDGVTTPEPVLGVSIRAYQAHLAPLEGTVRAVLADPTFDAPGDEVARYLVLEGVAAFDDRYPSASAARDAFLSAHPAGSTLGALARGDGLRGAVAEAPVPPEVQRRVLDVLADAFRELAPSQGLRFRSSSNVEDVEGFVGAGLYASFTGYLDPAEGDSLADALRATFASYWGAEAFEERHAVGLAHEHGAMGVTVHPNFPDEVELANGVLHLARLPDGSTELVVNSQLGAISVTNPPVDACRPILPEVAVVTAGGIERRQASTEAEEVLTDAELLDLWTQVVPVLDAWIDVDNAATDDARDRAVQTLDLEFRKVDAGWPAFADGRVLPPRTVVKQCRSLEPSPAGLPDDVRALPVPKDVLARAKVVTERSCALPTADVVATLVLTDPALTPDLGHAVVPFVGVLEVDGVVLDWRDLAAVEGTGVDDLTIRLGPSASVATGLSAVSWGPRSDCVDATRWASPATWLDDLLSE